MSMDLKIRMPMNTLLLMSLNQMYTKSMGRFFLFPETLEIRLDQIVGDE